MSDIAFVAVAVVLLGWAVESGLKRIAKAMDDRNAIERQRLERDRWRR